MRNMFEEKINKYPVESRDLFSKLNGLIFAVAPSVQARLWGGLPSFYVGERFVRLIPFKDHITVEAAALKKYKAQFSDCKFTPKNMLQIGVKQQIPYDVLTKAFDETLNGL